MIMTEEELQSIINAVLSSIRTNSKTIDQLTAVEALGENDFFEVNGGRKISYTVLAGLISALSEDGQTDLKKLVENNVLKDVSIDTTESTATLTVKSVGKTISCAIPIATDSNAGIISALDKVKIGTAYDNAKTAKETAETAKSTAQEAKTTAGEANKNAASAVNLAQQANVKADGAYENSSLAMEAAEQADNNASEALQAVKSMGNPSIYPFDCQVYRAEELSQHAVGTIAYSVSDKCFCIRTENGYSQHTAYNTTNGEYKVVPRADILYRCKNEIYIWNGTTITPFVSKVELENEKDNLRNLILPRTFINVNELIQARDEMSLEEAIEHISSDFTEFKTQGLVLTFRSKVPGEDWASYQYIGGTWTDKTNWQKFGGRATVGNCYNVTNEQPLNGGYYTLETAIKATFAKGLATGGLQITFAIAQSSWKTYQYIGTDITEESFTNVANWIDLAGMSAGSEPVINIDNLCGSCQYAQFYTLEYAISALLSKQTKSGITYAKSGLVITYKTDENTFETKQFNGEVSDFGTAGLWTDFGGAGGAVETKDEPKEDGKDAFSTGGAYKHIPTKLKINTETEGVVKIQMVNANGDGVGDEEQFNVGTGSGGFSGTLVNVNFKQSPLYASAGGSVILEASIQSVTQSAGGQEITNNIESAQLIDRDTNQVLETYKLNKASSASSDTFDFEFDLSSYFTEAGARRFKLLVTDDGGNTGSRNINVTAVDVTITSMQTLNYTSSTALEVGGSTKSLLMYKFANNASDKGIECITEIYINGEWLELGRATVNDTYSHSISINPNNCVGKVLVHSAYPIRIHGVDIASGVVGNYLHTAIMVVEKGNATPIVVTRWYSEEETATLKLYQSVNVDFAVYVPGETTSQALVYFGQRGDMAIVSTQNAMVSSTYTFKQKVADVNDDGTVTMSMYVASGTSQSQVADFLISGSLIDISEVAGAEFNLDFQNRSNSESDHTISDSGVTMSVEGANWSTNGFVKDSFGTSQYNTETDNGVMSLRVAENVKATLNYKPFDDASIETNGMAVQFTIRKRNMANDEARLISCIANGVGFYVTGQNVVFTTDNASTVAHTITAALKDDSPINVAIVIEPSSRAPYSGIGVVKMYFDGEEIGACYYENGAIARHNTPISFDGTEGEMYLYNIKAWKTYYNFEQAFNNYLLKMSDTDAMIEEFTFNSVMAPQTAENVTKNRPQANALYDMSIPYFVVCKNADTADNDAKDNYPEYLETLDGDKKTTRILDIYAYFPNRPWQDFKAIGCTVSNQGTTSSKRPIKNIKIKLKTATISLLRDRSEFTTPQEVAYYDECAKNAENKRVQIYDTSLPTNIITVKVDYSESGGANNGASTHLFNDLQRALGSKYMTPAQNAYVGTYTLTTSIDSTPCAFFRTDKFSPDATSPSYGYFHAKGNWNEDKGDAEVFGFEGVNGYNADCLNYGDFTELVAARDQSIADFERTIDKGEWDTAKVYLLSEFCGPNSRIYRYQNGVWTNTTGTMSYNNGKWVVNGDVLNPVENFELLKYDGMDWYQGVNTLDDMLTPDTDGKPMWLQYFESRYPDDDDLNDKYEKGLKVPYNLYRWLRWCQDCNQHLTEADGNITINGTTVEGTAENRLKKYKQELHTMANVHSVMCYTAFIDYLAAVDQESKNSMLGFYLDTDGVSRVYMNHLYDGDTILGSDNDCGLTIPVDVNMHTDEGVYQGWDSVLFKQLSRCDNVWLNNTGSSVLTLREVVNAMRECTLESGLKPFSPAGLEYYWITLRLNKWPKLVSSYDGERKYIEHSTASANYFYALHGLSIQRLQDFIEKRFEHRDGYYQTGDLFKSAMSMRATGTNIKIKIKAAKDGYFGLGVDRANSATDSCYLNAGEEYTFQSGMTNTGSGTMLYLFGADKVEELDISEATPSGQSWDISELVLLKKFKIGGADFVPTTNTQGYLKSLNLGNMPFLEELDIRNTEITSVNATYCPRIKSILAAGSKLQSCTLAETSPIDTLELPSTLTSVSLVNLPNLTYPGGLSFEGLGSVSRFMLSGCPNIEPLALINDIVGSSSIKYIRIPDVNITASYQLLLSLKANGAIGLDQNGNAYDESNQCSGLTGRWILQELVDDSVLEECQAYFPRLELHNSQFSVVGFDDTASDPENVTNYDNNTGYEFSTDYVASGHFKRISERANIYKALYDSKNNVMRCKQISNDNYTVLADGTSFDPTDNAGEGFDVMKLMPKYWYKGVNDFKNQKKYLIGSSSDSEPLSTATIVKRAYLKDCLQKPLSMLTTDDLVAGSDYELLDNGNMNVYSFDVEGMKQVRWPGVNNASIGVAFVDSDNKIISTYNMAISHSLFDFVLGEYIFIDVPAGAKKFIFTSPIGFDDAEVIAVDSKEIEAIEPDWVLHKPELIGVYGVSIDTLTRPRSISGVKTQCGTGVSTTNTDWKYDKNGKLTNVSAPASTMNYTGKDFLNLCNLRGEGYQSIDYEMSKDVANLFYAIFGNRDAQVQCGYGTNAQYTTGKWDSIGNSTTERGNSNVGNKILGLENFIGCNCEWMDNLAINVASWESFVANKCIGVSGDDPVDAVWHIYNPIEKTERVVQGINVSEYCIGRVKFGRHADVIASRVTNDNSKWNEHYSDVQYYSHSIGRCVFRSHSHSHAHGGLAYAYAVNASSYSNTHIGARLAFRGEIVIDE